VYGKVDGAWRRIGDLAGSGGPRQPDIADMIRQSKIKVEPTAWSDVSVGGTRFVLHRTP
jgi:hypothetical protein